MSAPYDRVSLVSIGRTANASDALVLRYFETKANLYLAVWERRLEEFLRAQAIADDTLGPETSATDRLAAGLRRYLDFVAERPRAWARQFLAPDGEPAGAAEFRRHWHSRNAELIRERGSLPDIPLINTALNGYIALNEALCLEWVLQDCPAEQREDIVALSTAALLALVAQAERSATTAPWATAP